MGGLGTMPDIDEIEYDDTDACPDRIAAGCMGTLRDPDDDGWRMCDTCCTDFAPDYVPGSEGE